MNRVSFPLKNGERGQAVADLQDALLAFLERGAFLAHDEAARKQLTEAMRPERDRQTFGDHTQETLRAYQKERGLDADGDVDEKTAHDINALLAELGLLDRPAGGERLHIVSGRVLRDDDRPFAAGQVRAFHEAERGAFRLGHDVSDSEGRYTIRYQPLPGDAAVNLRVTVSDAKGNPLHASDVIQNAQPVELVDLRVPDAERAAYLVEGEVVSRVSAAMDGLAVQIVDKGVGGDAQLAKAITDERGAYRAAFTYIVKRRGKARPDLQAQVFAGDRLLAVSEVRYDAKPRETLNVRLDDKTAATLASEHETLTRMLIAQGVERPAELLETDEQQDITYLANKSGWDARAVALASLAEQFSARTADAGGAALAPPLFYALFRAGLPANEQAVYRINALQAEAIWRLALKQGVIAAELEAELPAAAQRFEELAAQRLLAGPAVVGLATLPELAAGALDGDADRRREFATLYARHRGDTEGFWSAVRGAFGEPVERRLKLDGRLAYLTLNNAALIGKLHAAGRLSDTTQLVERGLYRAEAWRALLGRDPVPPEVVGSTAAEKRARYTEILAAQVRLSHPTAVVAQQVKDGATPVAGGLADRVTTFLTEHQGQFEIGLQPVEQYVIHNELAVDAEVTNAITRIQRVYQITPSDEAMNALLNRNIGSAYAVARYDRAEFVRAFQGEVGGAAVARQIHAKAQQVHNATLNIAVSYLTARSAPGIGVHSPAQIINPTPVGQTPHTSDVIAYSTLENLFGGLDYCDCEHCRSLLSPAAYLVDLLLFLERGAEGWTAFLAQWHAAHAGAPYPFVDQDTWQAFQDDWNARNPGQPLPDTEIQPLDVLLSRRPDLQHLPLSCENTNTPLPYIDLVNETLEYFVTSGLSLAGYSGHTTDGSAEPAELLANPQFVSDAAYASLAGEHFPLPLPFHLPLEQLRRYFMRFDAPLPRVMEDLRLSDALERPDAAGYGRRDILMEELGLSRSEHRLLTDRTVELQQLYGFPAGTSDADIVAALSKAKDFTRRTGITYVELVELLKTRFINPNSTLLPRLERLGVPFSTLKAYKDGDITDAQFEAAIAPQLDPSRYGGDIKAWVKNEANYANIMGLITLTDPSGAASACDFDAIELRYAEPDNAANSLRPFEFVRLIRFIRLWRKLGWSIAQTDLALTALYPANQVPNDADDAVNLQRLDTGFLLLLPRLGTVKRLMDELALSPRRDLPSLLACFAQLDTHGETSLYRRLFLSAAQVAQDDAFADDGYGNVLTDSAARLLAHAETLRAGCGLTADELEAIVAELDFNANTGLTLANVSAVYRRAWLARTLKLSVRELLVLIRYTGLDPFAAPEPPTPPIVRFVELVRRLKDAGLKPAEALYLIWNEDVSGASAPAEADLLAFVAGLRAAFTSGAAEFAPVADDPDGQIARARMALVYGPEATDLFFSMLDNTLVNETPYNHPQPALEAAILAAAPGRIGYDHFRKQLSYTGLMTATARATLIVTVGVTAEFLAAVDALYAANQLVSAPFFARYPELLPLHSAYTGSADPVDHKRAALLAAFLPELERRRRRQQALQSASAATGTPVELALALLDDPAVLHAVGDPMRPALDDLTGGATPGLSARFFFSNTATGPVGQSSDAEANLAYRLGSDNPLPAHPVAGNTISSIWSGYLEAPENGLYNLGVETDASAGVRLELAGTPLALTQAGGLWTSSAPVELLAGTLYPVTLTVENVRDTLLVRWETRGRGWEVIPARALHSAALMDRLRQSYLRFLKAASLAQALRLTPAELAYLAAHGDYQIAGAGWLNALPAGGSPNPATARALFSALDALLEFAGLKAALAPNDERLLTVLRDPAALTPAGESVLLTLTRWEPGSLDALLARFGHADRSALRDLETFARVYNAYTWVKQLGIPATALITAATNEPTAATVRDLQAALRARHAPADWLALLQPINDQLRELRRDALVAYVLRELRNDPNSAHIDTADKLFEYFLMDVQTAACMQTSRIRQALSSVQLFISRCLMNLEPRVAASALNARHWEWMSRYRVWEANRKIFLYPENWLEPELRDDQSPFFKEALSELLQADITEERASVALLNYLAKLDEVAKLEPCGIHYVTNDDGANDDIAHVVARTSGANRKHFYRRREYGSWTPWEQLRLDIEGDPVLPVVWKNRLFIFWLRILQHSSLDTPTAPSGTLSEVQAADVIPSDPPRVTLQALLCWSEYYNGKWQAQRTSDADQPLDLGSAPVTGANAFDRAALKLSVLPWTRGALRVIVSNEVGAGSSFFLHNTFSQPELRSEKKNRHFSPKRLLATATTIFQVEYPGSHAAHGVLHNVIADRTIAPNHPADGSPWDTPFFYSDSRHTFYVTTSERLVRVPQRPSFGIDDEPTIFELEIPPLYMTPRPLIPDPIGPYTRQPGFGVTDPSPLAVFITEDAYLRHGIASAGTVRFGDKEIGPTGSRIAAGRTR